MCVVMQRDTLGKAVCWNSLAFSGARDVKVGWHLRALSKALIFYSPASSFKQEHLWFYPKPEVGPSVLQCVIEVVCPLAKNRLITAILAVPGKVDSPSHFCFCMGRAPSEVTEIPENIKNASCVTFQILHNSYSPAVFKKPKPDAFISPSLFSLMDPRGIAILCRSDLEENE